LSKNGFETSCLDKLKSWSSEIFREALPMRNFSWLFLNLLHNFSSKVMFLNSKKFFLEHSIRVILENDIGSFQTFLILQIWGKLEVLKRFQKQFWKLDSKPKTSHILWFSENTLCSLSEDFQWGHFQCFWSIYWGLP
jgi:hypothetical protein